MEKLRQVLANANGEPWTAYSDSFEDLPLLRHAEEAFLVNGSARLHKRLAAAGADIASVRW
jgi:phosphoserine phosphatase